MLIFVDDISPRIEYVMKFVFLQRKIDYRLTTGEEEYHRYEGVKFAYSQTQKFSSSFTACSLLYESDIKSVKVEQDRLNFLKFNGISDPFASIFFVLTRYEEYICSEKDQFGRFPFNRSILSDQLVNYAICDRWAEDILVELEIPYKSNINIKIIPTFDIDNTYAYRLKTGSRKFLAFSKDRITGNSKRIRERKAVLRGEKDPYDTFDRIKEVSQIFPETKVFWLVGKWGKKDRNISIHHPKHQQLIREMAQFVQIGLHPSYASFLKEKVIQLEQSNLVKVIQQQVDISRQHFLRFSLPETYRSLIKLGFKEEFSMGFADHVGFRCGTARPHKWFDLSTNSETELCIRPFVYMDGSFREYMKLSKEESKDKIQSLYKEVTRYGGDFIFIWHNETIGDYGNWEGWSEVLTFTLNLKNE